MPRSDPSSCPGRPAGRRQRAKAEGMEVQFIPKAGALDSILLFLSATARKLTVIDSGRRVYSWRRADRQLKLFSPPVDRRPVFTLLCLVCLLSIEFFLKCSSSSHTSLGAIKARYGLCICTRPFHLACHQRALFSPPVRVRRRRKPIRRQSIWGEMSACRRRYRHCRIARYIRSFVDGSWVRSNMERRGE